jgi:hypothetical protein
MRDEDQRSLDTHIAKSVAKAINSLRGIPDDWVKPRQVIEAYLNWDRGYYGRLVPLTNHVGLKCTRESSRDVVIEFHARMEDVDRSVIVVRNMAHNGWTAYVARPHIDTLRKWLRGQEKAGEDRKGILDI